MPRLLVGKIFEELADESDWDVGVIGEGPNGLLTSAYLAKADLRVALIGEFVLQDHLLGRDLAQEAALRAVVV